MTELTCLAHTPPGFNDTDFGLFKELDDYARVTLHVPASSVNAYQTAVIWSNFSQIVGDAPDISEDEQDFMVDGIYYHVEEGQATVTNNGQTGCYSGDVVIPDVVTYQGISYPVIAVGDSAFKDCAALTNITLCDSITIIGTSAFQGCTGLTSITIPNSVSTIDDYAFKGCGRIAYIALGSGVARIGRLIFDGCNQLTDVISFAVTPPTVDSNGLFDNMDYYAHATLHVQLQSLEAYQSALCWKDFYTILGDVEVNNLIWDVNGDGEINIADLNAVIVIIINGGSSGHGHAPGTNDSERPNPADVNGDGEINIADINSIINKILGK